MEQLEHLPQILLMKHLGETVPRDNYYQIDVVWEDNFKHSIPARGYNLGSWIQFHDSIEYIKKHSYKEITKAKYEKMVYGSTLD
jgi:hypothetical protein